MIDPFFKAEPLIELHASLEWDKLRNLLNLHKIPL
jgi:hypothetical protein